MFSSLELFLSFFVKAAAAQKKEFELGLGFIGGIRNSLAMSCNLWRHRSYQVTRHTHTHKDTLIHRDLDILTTTVLCAAVVQR